MAEGSFRITRPPQRFKRLLATLLGMPAAAENVPTTETPVPGGWHAKVQLSLPLIGEMLGYEGEIYPTPHS